MRQNKMISSIPEREMTKFSSADYNFRFQDIILGAQMLFVAFGALVLVPILVGLDPNVALFTSGLGTLCFQLVTGGKVPVYLASSFAFYCSDYFERRKIWNSSNSFLVLLLWE